MASSGNPFLNNGELPPTAAAATPIPPMNQPVAVIEVDPPQKSDPTLDEKPPQSITPVQTAGTHDRTCEESSIHTVSKAQLPIAVVTGLGAVILFIVSMVQSSNDTNRCLHWRDDAGGVKLEDLNNFINPYLIKYSNGDAIQCGWPVANTAYRSVLLGMLTITCVFHVVMRTGLACTGNRYVLKPAYFLWCVTLFASFCVDCSSIRIGAGACADYSDAANYDISCSTARFVGLACGELLLAMMVYVLFRIANKRWPDEQHHVNGGNVV